MDSSKYAGYRKSRGENRASPGKQNGVVPTERAAGSGQWLRPSENGNNGADSRQ